uniref:UDP-glucuronosyltransferase n=1 Tax=Parastrongyloides trichosuri TaxID=131310 RepID=A0A0N4ZZH0_PARTI
MLRLVIFLSLINIAYSYKILIYNPRLSHSHITFVGKIADILQEAGNDVTVLQQIQAKNVTTIGSKLAKVIILNGADTEHEMLELKKSFDKNIWSLEDNNNIFDASAILNRVWKINEKQCKTLISNQTLIKELKDQKFDIGFAETFSSCGFGILNKVNIKTIISGAATGFGEAFFSDYGLPFPTSYLPPIMGGGNIPKGFRERLRNVITYHVSKYMYVDASIQSSQRAYNEIYGNNAPNIAELIKNVAFSVINTSPLLDFPHPTTSKIVEIAGIELAKPNKVDEQWDRILNLRPKNVLISFGSAVMSYEMPLEMKLSIVKSIKQFPETTFIWKYESNDTTFADGCDNIIFKEWIPQIEILNDVRLNLFVTHGGLNSAIELASRGTPAIFIPLFSDQKRNAFMLGRYGSSKVLNKINLMDDKIFSELIREMLMNDIYKVNAKKLSSMVYNYPLDGKNKLIKSFAFACEFGHVKEMDLPSVEMNFVELYNLDIYTLAFFLIIILFLIIFKCLHYILIKLIRTSSRYKQKKE